MDNQVKKKRKRKSKTETPKDIKPNETLSNPVVKIQHGTYIISI